MTPTDSTTPATVEVTAALLPCPFCSATVEHAEQHNAVATAPFVHHPVGGVAQSHCPLAGKFFLLSAWNTRLATTPAPAAPSEVERIAAVLFARREPMTPWLIAKQHGQYSDIASVRDGCLADAKAIAALAPAATDAGPTIGAGEDFLTQLRRFNLARYEAWVEGADAGIMFDALELGGEVGELLNVVKKLEREERGWRGSRADTADFADECADVLICLDKLARRRNVDLAAATVEKFNATSAKVRLPHTLALAAQDADAGMVSGVDVAEWPESPTPPGIDPWTGLPDVSERTAAPQPSASVGEGKSDG